MNGQDFFGKSLLEYLFDIVELLQDEGKNDSVDLYYLYAIKILQYLYENNFQYLVEEKPIILEIICKYYQHYLSLNRSSLLKSTVLLRFCQMIYFSPSFMLKLLQKLSIYNDVLYGIYGNLDLYTDCDDQENFLLGIVGLFSVPEKQFPEIIPKYSLISEALKSMTYLMGEYERNENFEMEEAEDEEDKSDSNDKSWNEDELLDEDITYDSPFEDISAPEELRKAFLRLEQ